MLKLQITTLGLVLLGLNFLATTGRADEVVKAIRGIGGSVQIDNQKPGKPVVSVSFKEFGVTDADLKELKELKSLRTLILRENKIKLKYGVGSIPNVVWKELKELKSLQSLSLS